MMMMMMFNDSVGNNEAALFLVKYRLVFFLCLIGGCCFMVVKATEPLSIPVPAQFFDKQLVDHHHHRRHGHGHHAIINNTTTLNATYSITKKKYWKQRYYTYSKHFQGPGHVIFLIMGGEGAIEPTTGIYYPIIAERYAETFGAFVIQPEHRFYGTSQPISREDIEIARHLHLIDPRVHLLTSEQALLDAIRLIQYTRYHVLNCSKDKFSIQYCPVIIVGGSYPGFLAAMGRLRFPHVIDMAYAASAPIKFYAQRLNESFGQYDYYNHITKVAETAYPGCAIAVTTVLSDFKTYYYNNHNNATTNIDTHAIGICNGTLPSYIIDKNSSNMIQTFIDEVIMMVGYTFANANMAYYPPNTNTSSLYRACAIFSNNNNNDDSSSSSKPVSLSSSLARLKKFLVTFLGNGQHQNDNDDDECFDMMQQLPTGPHATISGGDWSGVGTKSSGESWDFQTCTLLVEAIGFGPDSMFATTTSDDHHATTTNVATNNNTRVTTTLTDGLRHGRDWSLDWLTRHCQDRFGHKVIPQPDSLVNAWHFDPEHLVKAGGSRIIFTNGLNDGWSVSGIQSDLSDDVLTINFPNGAHHSDLNGMGNHSTDTSDIQQGTRRIQNILAKWLAELPSAQMQQQ